MCDGSMIKINFIVKLDHAAEYVDGSKEWWINGRLNREDGPAIEYKGGLNQWFVNGHRHRLDGPAIERAEHPDGIKTWWINGKQYMQHDFPQAVVMFLLDCDEKAAELILSYFE
jgi:hypothetical protein